MNKDDMVVEKIKLLEEQVASLAHRVKILESHDRAGYIFQVGKRRDPYTGVEGVIYSKKCPARATNTDKATEKNTLFKKYTTGEDLSNA